MDFKDIIKHLGERISKLKDQTSTEEATKTAFVMPFLQSLGYDVFSPTEVVPEFDADVPGLKKGEKVDYAILKDGQPKILIECKHWKQKLDFHDGQLMRYFHVTKAKFGILTNGIQYRFFTDLFETNKMDSKAFLEIDLTQINDNQIEELKKFHKSYFDEGTITTAANELIYTNEIKNLLAKELKNPSDDFVKYFAQKTYPGRITQNILTWFSDLVKRSAYQVMHDTINERLSSAMKQNEMEAKQTKADEAAQKMQEDAHPGVQTTTEEMEGFYIVKSICRQKIDPGRIVHRDALSYFAILLDDNNRKPICRLHLNRAKKFIETFENKIGDKKEINSIDDIYRYTELLLKSLDNYLT
jgi:hypothetical protein